MVASDERPFDVIPFEVGSTFAQIHLLVIDDRTGHQGKLEEARLRVFRERLQRSASLSKVPFCIERSPGTYLGIDVAIKEVLPSNDYDVAKYFEREWRLMKWVVKY